MNARVRMGTVVVLLLLSTASNSFAQQADSAGTTTVEVPVSIETAAPLVTPAQPVTPAPVVTPAPTTGALPGRGSAWVRRKGFGSRGTARIIDAF